ncbi:protein of unknown function [Actinopolyspora mzabensis]|uniref:DUF397 domain-containing protein n=1 Tax=Actinopolyspora mzabensis TaxID=995066 RepID=A0A1G9DG01_ACTMZ|nr:DUF397 domain-containing protein [Actinopolyspora mzabensis]SDK62805.1 protein of unknown function [Actinopolyspora mzabensis]
MLFRDKNPVIWHTSSYSGNNGTCVEVGFATSTVLIRDTKNREGGTIALSSITWQSFLSTLKHSTPTSG